MMAKGMRSVCLFLCFAFAHAAATPPNERVFIDLRVSQVMIGVVIFMMGLFLLLSSSNPAVRTASWAALSRTLCVFMGPFINSSVYGILVYYCNFQPPTAPMDTRTIVLNMVLFVFWYLVQTIGLSRAAGILGLEDDPNELRDFENSALKMDGVGTVLGFVHAAASMQAFGALQQLGRGTQYEKLVVISVPPLAMISFYILFRLADRVRDYISNLDSHVTLKEAAWGAYMDFAEDKLFGITESHLLIQTIRYFCHKGSFPGLNGQLAPGYHEYDWIVVVLLLSGVGFIFLAIAANMLPAHFGRIKVWLRLTFTLSIAWVVRYTILFLTFNHFGPHPFAVLCAAVVSTLVGESTIIILEVVYEAGEARGKYYAFARELFVPMGVLIGFSWQDAWTNALGVIVGSLTVLPSEAETLIAAFLLLALVCPVWYWKILPQTFIHWEPVPENEKTFYKDALRPKFTLPPWLTHQLEAKKQQFEHHHNTSLTAGLLHEVRDIAHGSAGALIGATSGIAKRISGSRLGSRDNHNFSTGNHQASDSGTSTTPLIDESAPEAKQLFPDQVQSSADQKLASLESGSTNQVVPTENSSAQDTERVAPVRPSTPVRMRSAILEARMRYAIQESGSHPGMPARSTFPTAKKQAIGPWVREDVPDANAVAKRPPAVSLTTSSSVTPLKASPTLSNREIPDAKNPKSDRLSLRTSPIVSKRELSPDFKQLKSDALESGTPLATSNRDFFAAVKWPSPSMSVKTSSPVASPVAAEREVISDAKKPKSDTLESGTSPAISARNSLTGTKLASAGVSVKTSSVPSLKVSPFLSNREIPADGKKPKSDATESGTTPAMSASQAVTVAKSPSPRVASWRTSPITSPREISAESKKPKSDVPELGTTFAMSAREGVTAAKLPSPGAATLRASPTTSAVPVKTTSPVVSLRSPVMSNREPFPESLDFKKNFLDRNKSATPESGTTTTVPERKVAAQDKKEDNAANADALARYLARIDEKKGQAASK